MVVTVSSAAVEEYAVVALLGLYLLRRTYRMTQGVPATTVRLVLVPIFYVGLYALELAGIGFAAVGSSEATRFYGALSADVALLAVGTYVAHRVASRQVELYRPPGKSDWYYRLRPLLPVTYIVLFFVRVGLETAFLGIAPFTVPTTAQFDALSTPSLTILFVVDALWGLTTGFLVGRSGAVYAAWKRAEAGPGTRPPSA